MFWHGAWGLRLEAELCVFAWCLPFHTSAGYAFYVIDTYYGTRFNRIVVRNGAFMMTWALCYRKRHDLYWYDVVLLLKPSLNQSDTKCGGLWRVVNVTHSQTVGMFTVTFEHTINHYKPVKEQHTETFKTTFWCYGDSWGTTQWQQQTVWAHSQHRSPLPEHPGPTISTPS